MYHIKRGQATFFPVLPAWRGLYGEKTVRKAERAWFLSEGEESKALGINGARPHFLYENVLFLTKWGLAPFIRWGKSIVFLNHIA
jgi:hypothetical protein